MIKKIGNNYPSESFFSISLYTFELELQKLLLLLQLVLV